VQGIPLAKIAVLGNCVGKWNSLHSKCCVLKGCVITELRYAVESFFTYQQEVNRAFLASAASSGDILFVVGISKACGVR